MTEWINLKGKKEQQRKAYLLGAKLLPLTGNLGNLVLGNWRIHEFDVQGKGKGYVLFI
jgi:hypothetical protein